MTDDKRVKLYFDNWKKEVIAHQDTKEAAKQTRFEMMMDTKAAWDAHDKLQDNYYKVLERLQKYEPVEHETAQ